MTSRYSIGTLDWERYNLTRSELVELIESEEAVDLGIRLRPFIHVREKDGTYELEHPVPGARINAVTGSWTLGTCSQHASGLHAVFAILSPLTFVDVFDQLMPALSAF